MVPWFYKEISSTVEYILSNTVSQIKCSGNGSDVIHPVFLKEFASF